MLEPEPPPRLHRQPGHGQDHRGPAAGRRSTARSASSRRGHLVETDRRGLVAGYVGQTATKVRRGLRPRPTQGVLLIDEAYSLVRGGEQRLRARGDRHPRQARRGPPRPRRRDPRRLPGEMAELVDANPGMRARFPEDHPLPRLHHRRAGRDLRARCARRAATAGRRGARPRPRPASRPSPADQGFGNGRLARNLFEACRRPPGQPRRRRRATPPTTSCSAHRRRRRGRRRSRLRPPSGGGRPGRRRLAGLGDGAPVDGVGACRQVARALVVGGLAAVAATLAGLSVVGILLVTAVVELVTLAVLASRRIRGPSRTESGSTPSPSVSRGGSG